MSNTWHRNPSCIKARINRELATVSMTPDHEHLVQGGDLLHCLSPEDYFIWIEEQQQQADPHDAEYYWD